MRQQRRGQRRAAHVVVLMAFFGAAPAQAAEQAVFEGPVARADCGPGSRPEPKSALQGEVTAEDRDSGRSLEGYSCNLELVGNEPGPGASWQHTWFKDCGYYDTAAKSGAGVQVVDVADPSRPETVRALQSPAMIDPWESLKVTENRPDGRKLLAGVAASSAQGALYFDIYDVEKDCRNPQLLSSAPVSGLNHEGNWSQDGMTYWSAGTNVATISAIDVKDPAAPTPIGTFNFQSHGISTSADGNRVYLAANSGPEGNGLTILDSSEVQAREPAPQLEQLGIVSWTDGTIAQHTVPVTIQGKPFLLFVDEGGAGAARFIDISDELEPQVVSKMKLEIHMPDNADRAAESAGGFFGYNAHYCDVDRVVDPTIVVCSMFNSGMRVFDVRDPYRPRELAYFNPGGTGEATKPGSNYDFANPTGFSTSGYATARPRIIRERGEIWFTDQNRGFFVIRFTNGVWPFPETGPVQAPVGLPEGGPRRECVQKAFVAVRIKVPKGDRARSAVFYRNGRRISTVRGRALRRAVGVRLPKGRHTVVRVVVTTRSGRRLTQSHGYTRCATA